ncbi:MAG: hypothetical protein ACE5JF_13035, partial [Anaerolineales bacterium]
HLESPPPCCKCIDRSEAFLPTDRVLHLTRDFSIQNDAAKQISAQDLEGLKSWQYKGLPLGELCLPGLRWALRRHHIPDDEPTRLVYRKYLASAASLAARFETLIEEHSPRAFMVFNGMFYPEAVARAVARRSGVPVITHEVGLQPYSAYFSHADATFRDLDRFQLTLLTPQEDERLERYLTARRSGKFSMAGIEFWPDMQSLPQRIMDAISNHRRTVTVFTNVVFDTSQVHANVIFPDMFAWLDELKPQITSHPESLFVIRAHPDEDRIGKASRESVADWFDSSGLRQKPNVLFIGPSDLVDSYELIERSEIILTYNSSIGLEAAIMGKPVLLGGRARFSDSGAVIAPAGRAEYTDLLEALLTDDRGAEQMQDYDQGRSFLYHELYFASLDFSEFLAEYPHAPGMVSLSEFSADQVSRSVAIRAIVQGVIDGSPFVVGLPEANAGQG